MTTAVVDVLGDQCLRYPGHPGYLSDQQHPTSRVHHVPLDPSETDDTSETSESHDPSLFVRGDASATSGGYRLFVRRLITSGELAKELGVSAGAVRAWVRDGLIVAAVVTPGGHRRYDLDEVRQRLKELQERSVDRDPAAQAARRNDEEAPPTGEAPPGSS